MDIVAAGFPRPARVLLGGSPAIEAWARQIGAAYAKNALGAVRAAERLIS